MTKPTKKEIEKIKIGKLEYLFYTDINGSKQYVGPEPNLEDLSMKINELVEAVNELYKTKK